MPFVLREEGATENPPLATVYGKQITAGKLAYYIKEGGRTKCILILGEGEMDGIDKLYYNGELLPEFSSTYGNDRIWRFHPGTITTQPTIFYDVTAISGDTLTLTSNPFSGSTSITENITATGGTRTYSFFGQTTAAVPYNATAASIQLALNNLNTVESGTITVGGAYPNITFSFNEAYSQWSNLLSVNTGNLTGGTSSLTRPSEVSIVAGVDPSTSPYPAGVQQHKKLYVVYSSGNNIKLSTTPGGSPVTWTSSAYLLTNLKVYAATEGFFDPIQGRPEFFSGLNFTLSGIAYVEVNLPSEMSEIEDEPTKFKIYVRGRRLQNYDASGQLADPNGVAYNPLALPEQTKFFSANNALVATDIILNYMKVDKSRIDWASWVVFRAECDQQITWNSGTTEILGTPHLSLSNATLSANGLITKTGSGNAWNSGALTNESTTSLQNIIVSAVYRGGHSGIGLTRATTVPTTFNGAGNMYSIHPSTLDRHVRVYEGATTTTVYDEMLPFQDGDTFKIEVFDGNVNFYKNATIFFTKSFTFGAGTTRGYVAMNTEGAAYSDLKFYPVTGATRTTNRFDAHLVFPSEVDSSTALQQVFGRCPSVHWQDVNGKIKFVVGTNYADITWGQTPTTGQRVLADVLSYDPNSTMYFKPVDPELEIETNHALQAIASASTQSASNFPVKSINNGILVTNSNWAVSEGWQGSISGVSVLNPEWVVLDFGQKMPISRVNVYSLKDAISYSSVNSSDTVSLYGLVDFDIQYWSGQGWTTIQSVVGNNLAIRTIEFPLVMTDRIRLYITKTQDGYARVIELQAVGPSVTSTVVPKSNIVENSFSSYKTPPENKANFLRIEVRDLDDQFFTKKYVYNDRALLRDQTGTLVDFGIVPLGVATQSLADRVGEATMRWNSDLDLFISLKGSPSTYPLSKGDIVKVAHDVTGWTLNDAVEFIVIEETIESGASDEKSYLLQTYNKEYYSDTAHGAITPNYPSTISTLSPPPRIQQLELAEESRTLVDGTQYSAIVGRITFNSSYPYSQRARVYWKRALDVEFVPTNIVVEQPNASMTQIPFELNFATEGTTEVKIVTETMTGVVSNDSLTETIDISGTMQVEQVEWEGLVNMQLIGLDLKKVSGAVAWDAGANSTKAIAFGNGYLQWTNNSYDGWAIGFSCYNYASRTKDIKYGLLVDYTTIKVIIDGVELTPQNPAALVGAIGQSYKIEITDTEIIWYQVIDTESIVIHRATNQQYYPLYVDLSVQKPNTFVPQVQLYGNLELTTGIKVHWQSLRGIGVSSSGGEETLVKTTATGWADSASAGTFSYERIPKNGAVEWIATETTKYRLGGLSEVDAEIADPTISGHVSIKYGIYTEIGAALSVREFVAQPAFNIYATGDVMRVERVNGTIRYRKNGQLIHTSTVQSFAPLFVDTAFYDNASTLKNFRVKRTGNFAVTSYPYPIYLVQDLVVVNSRPQDDGQVYFELAGIFTVEGEPIQRAKIKVFDKFGSPIADFPEFTYAGNGMIGSGFHTRAYADPLEEAIYEVRLDNGNGMSGPIYMKAGVESFVMPSLVNPATVPLGLTCVPVDHQKISLNWTFATNVDIWGRQEGGSWALIASNVGTRPYIHNANIPNTYFEYKISPTGSTSLWSNICRTKTLQAPLPTDTFPQPLSLVGTLNSSAPSTSIDLSWNRNSTTNTGVKIYQNGVLIYTGSTPTETTKTISGLTASTAYTFKVKNVYASGDSIDSNVVTVTTGSGASVLKPSGLSATPSSATRISLNWTNNTASGNVSIERNSDDPTIEASWSEIIQVPATGPFYANTGLLSNTTYWYRVRNTTVPGYSNVATATTFPPIIYTDCVTPDTFITVVYKGHYIQKQVRFIEVGDTVLTVAEDGIITTTKVTNVRMGRASHIHTIVTSGGRVIECSPSHPLIKDTNLQRVKAFDVQVGDEILVINDTFDKVYTEVVESKEVLEGGFKVMILQLEDTHTFISNGIVSHNRKDDI